MSNYIDGIGYKHYDHNKYINKQKKNQFINTYKGKNYGNRT